MSWVVCVFPPPVPITVIVYMPFGVEDEVVIVTVLMYGGRLLTGLKLHEAPEGRPLQDKLTGSSGSRIAMTVIVSEPDEP